MTLQDAKEIAAKQQGFESWESYEKYCQVTNVVKANPLKMIAMCDLYAEIYAKAKWEEGARQMSYAIGIGLRVKDKFADHLQRISQISIPEFNSK